MRVSIVQSLILVVVAVLPTVSAFHYRIYQGNDGGCAHDGSGQGAPPFDQGPLEAGVDGSCHDSPYGTNWDHLEIDALVGGGGSGDHIITYCNQGCQNGATGKQSLTHCFIAPPGCAIGSFRAIPGPNKI